MTIPGFILRNACRNKRRLILTILSVSISLFLLTVLLTALKLMTEPPTTEQAALRIVTRHRVSLANVLPEKYQYRIERMPGVRYCSKFTWFGGIYKDEASSNFAQFAVDADRIFRIFPEAVVEPRQEEAFVKEKTACVVGGKLAERFGWKVGDKITFMGALWPCDLELIVRGTYRGEGIDETMVFFHHEYFDELMDKRGLVGTFWITVTSADVIPGLIERIDAAFRNSNAETKTETERAFQLGFISMMGNVKLFIGSICTVIVFTMLLVTASTMAMAIRERMREISVLKAVGFTGAMIFSLILAESCGLALTGGFLGCFGVKFLAETLDIYKLSHGFLPIFPVTAGILGVGMTVAAGLGVISSLVPAYTSIKTTVVEGLKELD
jgi:putative ABC transport system permease protein